MATQTTSTVQSLIDAAMAERKRLQDIEDEKQRKKEAEDREAWQVRYAALFPHIYPALGGEVCKFQYYGHMWRFTFDGDSFIVYQDTRAFEFRVEVPSNTEDIDSKVDPCAPDTAWIGRGIVNGEIEDRLILFLGDWQAHKLEHASISPQEAAPAPEDPIFGTCELCGKPAMTHSTLCADCDADAAMLAEAEAAMP